VVSYNPGYQSVLKDLKASTRQRFVSIELGFPPPHVERQILLQEAGLAEEAIDDLVRLGQAIRRLESSGLKEAASTRTLIAAARLHLHGFPLEEAAISAIAGPLTDDPELTRGLVEMIRSFMQSAASAPTNA
jgi:nitric oxide reductase NorQ protein